MTNLFLRFVFETWVFPTSIKKTGFLPDHEILKRIYFVVKSKFESVTGKFILVSYFSEYVPHSVYIHHLFEVPPQKKLGQI